MKKILGLVCAAVLVGGLSSNANAGIHLEPYAGMLVSGELSDSSGTTDFDSGMGYGLRLGYGMLGLSFGVDYMMTSVGVDVNPPYDIDGTDLGAFVAYEFPVMLRVYAIYGFSSSWESSHSTPTTLTGKAMRFGVGYTGLPFVAINVEMWDHDFDEQEFAGNTTSVSVSGKATMLNLSFPFSL